MKKARKPKRPVSAEQIAKMADRGEDISQFFTNKGRMVNPIQRVNVDFSQDMLAELDDLAKQLNISRQALIKTLVRYGLDQRYIHRFRKYQRPPARNERPVSAEQCSRWRTEGSLATQALHGDRHSLKRS